MLIIKQEDEVGVLAELRELDAVKIGHVFNKTGGKYTNYY